MVGPWEQYRTATVERGPWDAFGSGAPTAQPTEREAQNLWDAVNYGIQSTASGLMARGKLPDIRLPEDPSAGMRLAAGAAGMITDLPLSIVAAVPGFIGGGAVGTAVAGPPGTAAGAMVGAGATGFGVPMAIREGLMTAYGQDQARTWNDVWNIAKNAAIGGIKGAVIGGTTMGAGRVAGAVVGPAAGTVARGAAVTGAELTTMTTAAAALEGRAPAAHEFMDNAILLFGLKGAVSGAAKLRQIYAETGKTPVEVRADAEANPVLREEMVGPLRPGEARDPIPAAYSELALQERVTAAIGADPRLDMLRQHMQSVMKGEAPVLDPKVVETAVRWEYAVDGPSAEAIVRGTEQLFRAEMDKATRGVVPDKATLNEGLQMARKAFSDATGLDPHVIGEAENAPHLVARALAVREASNIAVRKLEEIARKTDAEFSLNDKIEVMAALERVNQFSQDFRGARAEAGRALHIMRTLKYNKDALGQAEQLTALMEKNWGKYTFQDIAAMAAAMRDPAQLSRFAKDMQKATTSEKVLEAWKASILSGPLTHLANIMGNTAKFALEIPERALVTTLTAARRAIQGDPMAMAEYKAKAFSPLIGLKLGVRDALVVAGEVFRGAEGTLEKADIYRHAIEGKTGHFVRTPFRALQAMDALFRVPAERAKAYEMAVERALKEGFTPETAEYNTRVATYVRDPAQGLTAELGAKAVEAVQVAGGEAVFAQRLGPVLEKMQAAMQGNLAAGMIVPFVRTPANLLSWAVQHSPLFLLSKRWRDDFAAGGARRDQAVGRVVIGSMLSWMAYEAFDEGVLTGGGHFLSPEERRTKAAAGWQPYSLKFGDKYYSYQRLEPVSKVIGLVGDMMEMRQQKQEEGDRFKTTAAAIALFGNATISTTYLSGLATTFSALTDPTRYADRWFEGYATSLVPKIIGQTTTLVDLHKREVDGVVEAIQSQVPFLREKLLPQRDVWGAPVKNERLFGVLPVTSTTESKDKVKTEAARLELAISDVPKFVTERGPLKQRDRQMEIQAGERNAIKDVSGKFAMDILGPIVGSPSWDQIPDFAKANIYRDIIKDSRQYGVNTVLPPNDPRREALREKIVNEINKQAGRTGP